jgi:hypothetical protein
MQARSDTDTGMTDYDPLLSSSGTRATSEFR